MKAVRQLRFVPQEGSRSFSCRPPLRSGHNKWSKIKHDKARVDASVNKQHSIIARELQLASREGGSDVNLNPRLVTVIAAAKKQGFPKQSIENAIKRGQGFSPSGAALESVTLEAMIPPAVAIIIECQTDAKARLLQNLKLWLKEAGGLPTTVNHLFNRTGKIILENLKALTEEDVLDEAIEAGVTDMFIDDKGNIVIHAAPDQTIAAARILSDRLNLKVLMSEIVWEPKEELMVEVGESDRLKDFLDLVRDEPSTQHVYVNTK